MLNKYFGDYDFITYHYECENKQQAKIIIPRNATTNDILAIKEMFDVVLKRRYKVNLEVLKK